MHIIHIYFLTYIEQNKVPFFGPALFLGSGLLFLVAGGAGVFAGVVVLPVLLPVLFSCELQGGGGGMATVVKLQKKKKGQNF